MKSKFIKTAAAAILALSAVSACMHSENAKTTKADCKKGTCTKKNGCSKNGCSKNGCDKKINTTPTKWWER